MFPLLSLFIALLISAYIQYSHTKTLPSPTTSPVVNQSVLGKTTKVTGCIESNGLPDSACTPGDIDPGVTQENISSTICVSGYTKTVRPPESVTQKIKVERMAAYGDSDSPANYELDHLISLELGGSPDVVANLWPEPYSALLNAREKDKVENYLHAQVCQRVIPLTTAQEEIARNWVAVYNTMPKN